MADDEFRDGEEMGRAWVQGRSELLDDLAAIVGGMARGELGPFEKGFLKAVGEMARSGATRETGPPPAGAPAPARLEAQASAAPPALIDVDEIWHGMRERMRQARRDELWRNIS